MIFLHDSMLLSRFLFRLACFSFAFSSLMLSSELSAIINIPDPIGRIAEKKFNDSVVFVILRHARNEQQDCLWRRCYDSIRTFYPKSLVVIIDDNSPIAFDESSLKNTILVKSEYPGAGELLPYYYFLEHRWKQKMIFLHDSMLLSRSFSKQEWSVPVKFHWHFEQCWDNKTCINQLLSYLPYANELIDYNMNKKSEWLGCFGVASIIDFSILADIEEKYAFTEILKSKLKNREDRMALERIFAILLFKENYITRNNCSNFGAITSYPNWPVGVEEQDLERLKQTYSSAIFKTWHGR